MAVRPGAPNVVLIVADQLRADVLPCYGGQICRTPALDALAARAVVFDRAYTPLAVCSPARASLFTGLYPHNHGVASNQSALLPGTLPDDPSLLSRQLERRGYARWFGGKWHLGGPEHLPRDVGMPGHQFPGHGGGGYHYPEYQEYLRAHGLTFTLADGPHRVGWNQYGTLAGPPEVETSCFLTNDAIAFLDTAARERQTRRARGEDEPPFFLWLNYWGPHAPYFPPQSYLDRYRDVEIPPWPNFPDDDPHKPAMHRLKQPPEQAGQGWAFWEPAVRHYLAFITYIDDQIGRLLRRLEETGESENTVVLFTADHGESLGAHGCQDKGHFMYEETYRVPFLLRAPHVAPGREGAFVSLVDVCPTLLDFAGVQDAERGRDGRSLVPLLRDDVATRATWRSTVVAEFHGMVTPYTQRMIVDARWKYVWNMGDIDECYDLATDPYERRNLAPLPDHEEAHDAQRRLQRQLLDWMTDTHDPVLRYFARHLTVQGVAPEP